jgi:hypothetical protein
VGCAPDAGARLAPFPMCSRLCAPVQVEAALVLAKRDVRNALLDRAALLARIQDNLVTTQPPEPPAEALTLPAPAEALVGDASAGRGAAQELTSAQQAGGRAGVEELAAEVAGGAAADVPYADGVGEEEEEPHYY